MNLHDGTVHRLVEGFFQLVTQLVGFLNRRFIGHYQVKVNVPFRPGLAGT
jgi:hypothetical protein